MIDAIFTPPHPANEPVLSYAPGTPEREQVIHELERLLEQEKDLPMWIGAERVTTNDRRAVSPPHDHQHTIGHAHFGTADHVKRAIDAALAAKPAWEAMAWQDRAAIFLKAADLLSGPYRARMNAATMLAQSKNVFQAEIDAACEFADFLRFNVQYMTQIYRDQPMYSPQHTWNRVEYRPLEGFVFALTPFNFTSIAGNLPSAPALMGNVAVWKPAQSQVYSAQVIMELFHEAGLPDGVINLVHVSGSAAGDVIFGHPEFAGLHFTGSTGVFRQLWKTIADNLPVYRSYPRIVGETGGKDFVIAHHSADALQVATALSRGAFEFQGQKCSAASRAYVPDNLWPKVKEELVADVNSFTMGDPKDFSHFINAVIDEKAFDKIAGYIEHLKQEEGTEIIAGGGYDKEKGYFIEPTVAVVSDPKARTMCEEIFGPILTIYVYKADAWMETLALLDGTSEYALTGAVFARERQAIVEATDRLRNAAGNFYINDKPTGAVVGQQPFGGARGSGTNDKAGSYLNLLRWVNARTIKENFVPPTDHRYPFMG